VKGNCTFC